MVLIDDATIIRITDMAPLETGGISCGSRSLHPREIEE
jgi:hypothetical protein